MNSILTRLLRSLEAIPDDVGRRVDEAFNSFSVPSVRITDWDTYCALLAALYARLESAVLGIDPPRKPNLEFDFSRCVYLMEKTTYGKSAMQSGFEVTRTGVEGGLRRLLQTVAEAYAGSAATEQINALVSLYWERRTHEQLFSDMDEYIAAYKDILPSEVVEGGGFRIKAAFWKVLAIHPFRVRLLQTPLRWEPTTSQLWRRPSRGARL